MDRKLRNRYIAMRHGESLANRQGIILSEPAVGCLEFGLTDEAKQDLMHSADDLRRELAGVARIVSSDFRRARETAEIVGEILKLEVEFSPRLRERFFGEWEATSNRNYDRVWEADREDAGHTRWRVESVSAVAGRLTQLIDELEQQHDNAAILLVSHGDPLQILEAVMHGKRPERHRDLVPLMPAEVRRLTE